MLQVNLAQSRYVLGERLNVSARITNQTSKTIHRVNVTLVEVSRYSADERSYFTTHTALKMARVPKCSFAVPFRLIPRSTSDFQTYLTVPFMIPTFSSDIISVAYALEVSQIELIGSIIFLNLVTLPNERRLLSLSCCCRSANYYY